MSDNNDTRRSSSSLHRTREVAEALLKAEVSDSRTLTDEEKAIVSAHWAAAMSDDFEALICYAGYDVALAHVPAWKIGTKLMRSNFVGARAVGAQYMLSAVLGTPGALEEIVRGLWQRLGRLPLTLEDIETVIDVIKHESKGEVCHG